MDDEREKSRMKEVANALASLVSSLNLRNEEMPIETYVIGLTISLQISYSPIVICVQVFLLDT